MGAADPSSGRGDDLVLRPVRPADRERILEITREVWNGRDYIPRVFDRWVADAGAAFEAAEIEGLVVGVQRLRPYAPGLMWYEGLRVAEDRRRQGIARAMLQAAIAEAREQSMREIRLGTRDEPAVRLFESSGFTRLVEVKWWRGPRIEGGEPARIPDDSEAKKLWPFVSGSPGFELYGGVNPDLNGSRDLGEEELARLARQGLLRLGPSGRAVALLREPWAQNISVSLLAGSGGAMRELLMALRFEADADGLTHVTVNLPPGHPAEEDLRASGYDFADAEASAYIYALPL
ncbi:MAG TPA: GNAT family N-acetyltransferase [Candidatus Dormibacteraeota bacterium]|nr:GNAT family N-acetyltransferase [Candidatus Dormibacteraeota bacterium]